MRLVLAPTYQWYRVWCDEQRVNPHGRDVRYVSGPQNLRGWPQSTEVVVLGSYEYMPDLDLMVEVQQQVAIGRLVRGA